MYLPEILRYSFLFFHESQTMVKRFLFVLAFIDSYVWQFNVNIDFQSEQKTANCFVNFVFCFSFVAIDTNISVVAFALN